MARILFWPFIFLLLGTAVYFISDILVPFLISFVLAYLLQPLINSWSKHLKVKRECIVNLVFYLFLAIFVSIILFLAPITYKQVSLLIQKLPYYKDHFEPMIHEFMHNLDVIDPELAALATESANKLLNGAFNFFVSFSNHIWHYTMATINFFIIVALVPVLLYYFLRDWPKIVDSFHSMLPLQKKDRVREMLSSINDLLAAYIRGQLNVCLILTIYYAIGLHLINIDFALLLSIISGFFIIIPFIGTIISFLLVSVIAYLNFGLGIEFLYVAILFISGHIIEGYFLAPRIIGDKIGLHPVWIIFAVLTIGSLFGFWGIMFAIPIASVIKVCITNLINYYKFSHIYNN